MRETRVEVCFSRGYVKFYRAEDCKKIGIEPAGRLSSDT